MSTITATSDRARLIWPKQHTVGAGGWFNVYHDSRDGTVDYASPLNVSPIPAWPSTAGMMGFLLGGFLDGAFLEDAGGFGFLSGDFLEGAFLEGDADQEVGAAIGFLTEKLPDGDYVFGLKAYDAAGNASDAVEDSLTIAGTPRPASGVAASLDGDVLTIIWTLSPDDS